MNDNMTVYFREKSTPIVGDNISKIDYALKLLSGALKHRRVVIFGYEELGLYLMQEELSKREINSVVITEVTKYPQTQLNKFNSEHVQIVLISDSVREELSFFEVEEVIYFDVPPDLELFNLRQGKLQAFTPFVFISTKEEKLNYTLLLEGKELITNQQGNSVDILLERFNNNLIDARYNKNNRYKVFAEAKINRNIVKLINAITMGRGEYNNLPGHKKEEIKKQVITLL